jgi:hypothetical protein
MGSSLTVRTGVICLFFLGCSDHGSPLLPPDPFEVWTSYECHNYTIDQSRICFCPLGGRTMRITVRADTIASVVNLSDHSLVPLPFAAYYLTVDSMFGIIHQGGTDSLMVTYDETYGYPETLDINPQLHPVDGGVLYITSNLHIP